MKKFLKSFVFAYNGLAYALQTQRNLRIHFFIMALVSAAAVKFKFLGYQWAILVINFGVVIGLELINSSLEKLMDTLHPEQHPGIGKAKDMAAAAVLFASIISVVVAFFLFYHKIVAWWQS